MAQQDGSTQPQNAGTSSATISTQDVGTAPVAITASCEEVIAAYRAGNLSRTLAVDRLGSTIAAAPGGIGGNPGALQAHLAALDEWDRERIVAAGRGAGRAGSERDRTDEDEIGERSHSDRHPEGSGGRAPGPGIAAFHGIYTPLQRSATPTPLEPARASRWNDVDPSDYAWNWKVKGMPPKWALLEPLTRRTQEMRGLYAKDPKQAVASVLIQYDKPDFPPCLWKTVLLNDFLELEKLYGETFALEATKPDAYSLGDKLEIEIQDSGGRAKSKTIGEFGTWTVLWDQYAAAVVYAYPHRQRELAVYRKWILGYFKCSKNPTIVLDMDRACRRAILGDQTMSLDDKDSLAVFNFRFSDQGVGRGENSRGNQGGRRRPIARSPVGDDGDCCKRWNRGKCSNIDCRFSHVCSGCGGDHQRSACQRIGGTGKTRGA